MFTGTVARFRKEIADVKTVVMWQDALRNALAAGSTPAALGLTAAPVPSKLAWQIFDHCAAITRVYALFEKVICDLTDEFLAALPTIYPAYANLNERLRTQHRLGVGQILTKWSHGHPLFANLDEKDIAAGVADGLRGQAYSILSDAFLVDPENFRCSALNRLFANLGFSDVMAWIRKSQDLEVFFRETFATTHTVESVLDEFVRIRNEVAHGNVSAVASAKEIIDYAETCSLITEAIASLLRSYVVKNGVASGRSVPIANVARVFSQNVVGIESISSCELKIGDSLFAGKREIWEVKVVDLRNVDDPIQSITLAPSTQLGIKFDRKIPIQSTIYRWSG
jgi:hypothetical protein